MGGNTGARMVTAAAAAAAMLVAAGHDLARADSHPIEVGVIANLTGTDVRSSVNMVRGVELAVARVNEAGGVDGRPVELIVEDSEYRVQEALNAATKLYEVDQVEAAVMFGGSSLMMAVAELAQQNGKILLNTSSSSPQLGNFAGTLFSVLPLDDIMGEQLGRWVAEEGFATAAVIVPNNTFGVGLMEAAAAAFEAEGGEVLRRIAYTEQQPDYRADIQGVVQVDPDVIITAGYGDDSRTVFQNARLLGLEAPWYAVYPTIFRIEDPEWMDGRFFGLDNGGPALESAREVREAYEAQYDDEPLAHVFYGYDAMMLLAEAMRAGGTDADAIREALPEVVATYEGATGRIVWDERGQRVDPPIERLAYGDGGFQVLAVD